MPSNCARHKTGGWHTQVADYNQRDELEPKWKLPPELSLSALPTAINQSELFFLVEHSKVGNIVDEQQKRLVHKLPKDGYQAKLLCFSDPDSSPQRVFLKFDAPDGCPPVTGEGPQTTRAMFPEMPQAWMLFTTNLLFFGLERPDSTVPVMAHTPRHWL